MFNHLGKLNEVQSSIPSRMKRIFDLDIKTNSSLKVKRCTLVITSYETSSNSKEQIKEDGKASSHPITIWVANDLEVEVKLAEVPETSENTESF